jgi:hypothetical protein
MLAYSIYPFLAIISYSYVCRYFNLSHNLIINRIVTLFTISTGWTGVLCDKKFETCTDQPGHECYHGGQCIPGLLDKYGNEQLFCDCSTTHSAGMDGTHYVGKYCETPFEQACNTGAETGEPVFCVNGGECNLDFPYVPFLSFLL